MEIKDYLKNDREELPEWIKDYQAGQPFDIKEFMSHRVLYYPGPSFEAQPIRTFNNAHFLHTYVYADYGVTRESFLEKIQKDEAFRGYKLIDLKELSEKDLVPNGWSQHVMPTRPYSGFSEPARKDPFCYLCVLDRIPEYDDTHGAERFVLMYLAADGFATYDALFANSGKAPTILVMQDHGFGGNYDQYDKGHLLNEIAEKSHVFPEYILCAEESTLWNGYKEIPGVDFVRGGWAGFKRQLCKREGA